MPNVRLEGSGRGYFIGDIVFSEKIIAIVVISYDLIRFQAWSYYYDVRRAVICSLTFTGLIVVSNIFSDSDIEAERVGQSCNLWINQGNKY